MKRIQIFAISLAVLCLLISAALVGCSGNKDATASSQTEAVQATQSSETVAATTAVTTAAETEAETTSGDEESPLVGSWEFADGGGFTYTFNADGTGSYEMFGEVMDFTYTDNGDSFDVLFDDVDGPSTVEYTIDGDTLITKDDLGEDVKYVKEN